MDVREKLVELFYDNNVRCDQKIEGLADDVMDIIASGVTVQEEAKLYWKPVNPGEWNLTCSACDSHLGCKENAKFCPECGAKFVYPKAVAPQPPKGE